MKRKSVPRVRNTNTSILATHSFSRKYSRKESQMLWRLHGRLSSWKVRRQWLLPFIFQGSQDNASTPCDYWLDDYQVNDRNMAGQMFSGEGCLPPSLRYVTYILEWEKSLLQVTDFHTCARHAWLINTKQI